MFPIWGEEDGLDLDFLKEVVDHLRPFIQKGVVVLGLKKRRKNPGGSGWYRDYHRRQIWEE